MIIEEKEQIEFYRKMLRIRLVEEAIAEAYPKQKMRTPIHLSIGQEAAAVASASSLRKTDYAVSTHRAHAHYLAKGGNLNAMIAELHGKVTGCCRGRGGSMHLIDESVGFMGSTAIVGNTIPIGVGLGLAIQLDCKDNISCIFLGDGATEEGVFYESLNFAVLKKLPILFICENNKYSVYSPLHKRQPKGRKIYELAKAIGAYEKYVSDGYNVLECYQGVSQVAESVRSGKGPGFVEISTYRWREHCGPNFDNDLGYRSLEEYQEWAEKDSIRQYRKDLQQKFQLKDSLFLSMEERILKEIETAFQLAEKSDFPDAIEATTGQYNSRPLEDMIACEN